MRASLSTAESIGWQGVDDGFMTGGRRRPTIRGDKSDIGAEQGTCVTYSTPLFARLCRMWARSFVAWCMRSTSPHTLATNSRAPPQRGGQQERGQHPRGVLALLSLIIEQQWTAPDIDNRRTSLLGRLTRIWIETRNA